MKKRWMTFLLSAMLMFGAASDSVLAAPVWEAEASVTKEAPDASKEDGQDAEAAEPPEKLSGFRQPVFLDTKPEDLPEIYEETESQAEVKGSAIYRTKWDSYSTNYYYNLLNDNQRELWDKLDQMCYEYLTGTETLTGAQRYSSVEAKLDFWYYTTKAVSYSNMSSREARNVEFMFIVSNPQYYFLQTMLMGTSSVMNGGYAYLTINSSFANGEARKAATQQVQSVIDSWLPQIMEQPSDVLKEKKIHDMICANVSYDPYFNDYRQNEYNQTIYSVFCDPRKTTVCAGYSQAMQLLCNAAGIDCGVVTSADHEWNIIRLNGIWYYVDLTWNDDTEEELGVPYVYEYFNRSRERFMSGAPGAVLSHTPEDRWNGYLPELTYDSGAGLYDIGTVHTPSAALSAPQISCSGSTVTISAPAGTVYYTIDGTNPSIAFTKARRYTGPFKLFGPTMVRAVAVANGYYDSSAAEQLITPVYSVTYSANGGYIGNKNVKSNTKTGIAYGSAVGSPGNPKRKGYVFLGWYTKKSGGSKIGSSVQVTSDSVYYAHWAKINTKKKASVSSVKNSAKKTMKVTVKKLSMASGYQIRYSLHKNMSSAKKKEASGNVITVKRLKKGKTYYVQARMYQKESVSGKKKYASWGKTKKVKIKK